MTNDENNEVTTLVDNILRHANLSVSLEDQALLVEIYPNVRRMVQRLRIPEARHAELAVIFPASVSR